MKLTIREPFSLELEDETVLSGTIRELTKKEAKELKAKFKDSDIQQKELQKLNKQKNRLLIDSEIAKDEKNYDELKAILDRLDNLDQLIETKSEEINESDIVQGMLRERFNLTVKSDQIEQITQLAEDFGYTLILQTIAKDLEEKKPKE